jgi:hypothetical protein
MLENFMQPLETDETLQARNGITTQPEHAQDVRKLLTTDDVFGRTASPAGQESTSEQCHFWVERGRITEKSQIVRIESQLAGRDVTFYGLIEEVYYRSRLSDIHEAFDGTDGNATEEAPFKPEGTTYASVNILQAEPIILTPPIEQSRVYLGTAADAAMAYGFGDMRRALAIGRLRNGGTQFAGTAQIDLAYLLGENGGHLNVNGMPGVGTKSSFLLAVLKALLHEAHPQPGKPPLHIVPIILNVKGEDLMWLDRPNRDFSTVTHAAEWEAISVPPTPFASATFYSPTEPGSGGAPAIHGCNATAYGWALRDVLTQDLLLYLFADDDINERMHALVLDLASHLTKPDGLTLRGDGPQTWRELIEWMHANGRQEFVQHGHAPGTVAAVYRRLRSALRDGQTIFLLDAQQGQPLQVRRATTTPPQVIDIHSLPGTLQRFVVAAISKQVVAARMGHHAVPGLHYIIVLDELNRFAPRSGNDPITRLMEEVATERRSQGIILFGAQQFASEVSIKVVESAAVRVLGRTGPAELSDQVWRAWSQTARRQSSQLRPNEKLVTQPTFRAPMLVNMPFPAWAMRRADIAAPSSAELPEI